MANTLNTPDVLTQPIATNGTKNAIPNTNDQSLGLMSQSTGFPAICSERIADGGKAPRRADFNGAFNLVSQHHFFLQNGGTETFRQSVSDAIGGYPINSRLWFTNSNGESVIVRSLIANNTYNFNNDPSYIDGIKWVVDVESGAPVGSLMPYAGTTPPDGWLICDGSEISRTTYARLFSVIGTTYGAGDGNSSFNLPDLWSAYDTMIPNGFYQDETVGISGTIYTAPANCFLMIGTKLKNQSQNTNTNAYIETQGNHYDVMAGAASYLAGNLIVPLSKGQRFNYSYQSNVDTQSFRYVFVKHNNNITNIIKY